MNIKNPKHLFVGLTLLIFLAIIIIGNTVSYSQRKQEAKARLETRQKTKALLFQIENADDLVTNHIRYAKAYLRLLEVKNERMSRSWLMKMALPKYAPEKNLGPAIKALKNALVADDQILARRAVKETRKALIRYSAKLQELREEMESTRRISGRLPTIECTEKDEDILNELKRNFAASLKTFRLNGSTETAEQTFVDGWLVVSALGLIGPDYIEKYGELGRREVRRIRNAELLVLIQELTEFSFTLKYGKEEYNRVVRQSQYILKKTDELEVLLAKFNIKLN